MNRRAVDADARPGVDNKFNRHRSTTVVTMLMLVVAAVAVMTVMAPTHQAGAIEAPDDVASSVPSTPAPPETQPASTESPIATNEFIPDDQDLTTCIGVLERPGCGSKARGGWRQTLVFGILFVGLAIVFGNVAWGVSKGRRNQSDRQ